LNRRHDRDRQPDAAENAPLIATEGLLVRAGSPSILPPARPGTVAPIAPTPVATAPTADTPEAETAITENPIAEAPDAVQDPATEGLNVIAGQPPILPPVRPGTQAPQSDAALTDLSADIAAALGSGAAQAPTADTPRPLVRPTAVIDAAVAAANTPVLGALTADQAAGFRPRTRPAGLAPPPEPEPQPEPEPRPNPIVNPTAQAVPVSSRPDTRPRNMARIVERANQATQRAATQVAAVAPRTVAPSGPTGSAVARNATLDNAINLREVNLIGIYGGSNDRRALVRLANGRYVRVTVGDRLDGGRVAAISSGALRYTKRGREITLEVAG